MGFVDKTLYAIFSCFTFLFMAVVNLIFDYMYKGKGGKVSKVQDPILLMPASELSRDIRSRKLRAEDVMAAYIKRAKEVNVLVNAIVGEQYDKALRRAQELDQTLDSLSFEEIEEQFSEAKKPLLGVPLSVKEAFEWTGMQHTSGVVNRKHILAPRDAPVLANLVAAGAIPFIQTNVSEVCMWFESSNYVYGCTNNAYDTTRMVGGSSGGEGCILSTGASVIGIGSDIGGSIRMPCFFNGVFGHKPSPGVVDNSGQFPIANEAAMTLLATGPMCRYATDLIPALKVMAGPEGVLKLKLDTQVNFSKLKVISVPDDGGSLLLSKVDPELVGIQKQCFEYLKTLEADCKETHIKKFRFALEMWAAKMNLANGPKFATLMAGGEGKVNCVLELAKSLVRQSNHTLPAIALGLFDDFLPQLTKSKDLKAVQVLDALKEEIVSLLGDDTVLLYPSHPKLAPYHNHPIFTPMNFAYTALFNALALPVTQCPLGLSKDGLPLGIQVVTSPYNDHLSLAVAVKLEEKFGGWTNPL